MLEKIISGGQSGADQAGWRTAKAFGVSSGGWMPRGFLAEDGPHPEFADEYGADGVAGGQRPRSNRAKRPGLPTRPSGSA